MKPAGNTRRHTTALKPGPGQPQPPLVASRPLFACWPLLVPHFRGVLLAPHNRPDGSTSWTWAAPVASPEPSTVELATIRQRLAGARDALADAGDEAAESSAKAATLAALQVCMDRIVRALLALPDTSLAAYVARTDHGLFLHSWGLPRALAVYSPDAEFEIAGRVRIDGAPAPDHAVQLLADDGAVRAETATDANGHFAFAAVAAGSYRVRAASRPPEAIFPGAGEAAEILTSSVSGLELHNERTGVNPRTARARRRRLPFALALGGALALTSTCLLRQDGPGTAAAGDVAWETNRAPKAVAGEEENIEPETSRRRRPPSPPTLTVATEATPVAPADPIPVANPGAEPPPLPDATATSEPAPEVVAKPDSQPLPEPTPESVRNSSPDTNRGASASVFPRAPASAANRAQGTVAPGANQPAERTETAPEPEHEEAGAGEPRATAASAIVLLPRDRTIRSTLRSPVWQLRLLHDAIVPTLPARAGQDDALRELGARTLDEREQRKPSGLRPENLHTGVRIVWETEEARPRMNWDLTGGDAPAWVACDNESAEIAWRGLPPRGEYVLRTETGEPLVSIATDHPDRLEIQRVATVAAWPWLGVERTPDEGSGVSWQILGTARAPASWREGPHPALDGVRRLELRPPSPRSETVVLTLAAVDATTGWALVAEIEHAHLAETAPEDTVSISR